ncbi:MAG: GTP cyclohydrolase I [Candidatus Kapabacteria bacterium]|jgi:GTP cyclohydrolase I|nr:GTP cyclohydrolase I [Candidatus Kapabacteria bacterium]
MKNNEEGMNYRKGVNNGLNGHSKKGFSANGHSTNGHSTNGHSAGGQAATAQKFTCGHDHDDDIVLAEHPYAEHPLIDDDIDLDTGDMPFPVLPGADVLPRFSSLGYRLFDANGNAVLAEAEKDEMKRLAEQKMQELFDILRIDRNDPNSRETPHRLAKMWVDEIFRGRYEAPPKCTVFPNRKNVDELVISKGIAVMSVCSHHWQTISGTCAIGYVPGESVIGLSKLTRIVDWFGRRGQIQEELGEQIADYLNTLLKPKAVIVVIKSRHYCMIARGVNSEEDKALMITTAVRGSITHNEAQRNEFMTLIS